MKKPIMWLALFACLNAQAKPTGISTSVPFSDVVYKMETREDLLAVQFSEHAAIYKVKKTSADFARIEAALKNSRDHKKAVALVINALTLEIESLKK